MVTTGAQISRIAGQLLVRIDAKSELAIDALVVATTIRLGGGVVVTHDPDDLRLLASASPDVAIATI